jgi:hypothetical protein
METIKEIADAIDGARVGTPLANFYADRAEIRGVSVSRDSLFLSARMMMLRALVMPTTGADVASSS